MKPEPLMNLIASDQPTTCPLDGMRTVWLGDGTDDLGIGYHIEHCPLCENIFHVYEPTEEDDEQTGI